MQLIACLKTSTPMDGDESGTLDGRNKWTCIMKNEEDELDDAIFDSCMQMMMIPSWQKKPARSCSLLSFPPFYYVLQMYRHLFIICIMEWIKPNEGLTFKDLDREKYLPLIVIFLLVIYSPCNSSSSPPLVTQKVSEQQHSHSSRYDRCIRRHRRR